jgi:nitroreductase
MDLYELLMKRRSVRNFTDRPVPKQVVAELLDAAANAPTGGNMQPISIIVIEEPSSRAQLAGIVGGQPWVKNAPLSMVFCLDFLRTKKWAAMFDVDFRGERALALFLIAYADLMCAAQNVVILAESRGLGSVYIGTIQSNMDKARELLAVPECVVPMMALSLGYPKSIPRRIPKLERDVLVHREKYRPLGDSAVKEAFEKKYGTIDDDVDKYLERAYVEAVEADKQQEKSWVDAVKTRMKKLEIRSNAQFLFELRYPMKVMVGMNARLIRALRNAGFEFSGLE